MAINGTAGNDTLTGTRNSETISAGDGADVIYGMGGQDVVDAGAGDDLVAAAGTLVGGDGADTLLFFGGQVGGSVFDLALATAQTFGGSTYRQSGFENVWVADGAGQIYGSDGDNYLFAWNGSLFGRGGNDVLSIGSLVLDTTYDGGDGIDTLMVFIDQYPLSTVGISLNVSDSRFVSIENLGGTGGSDKLGGDSGANVLAGAGGADQLVGGAGDDALYGDGRWQLSSISSDGFNPFGYTEFVEDVGPKKAGNDQLEGGAATISCMEAEGSTQRSMPMPARPSWSI